MNERSPVSLPKIARRPPASSSISTWSREAYDLLRRYLPLARVYYAVKANPAAEIVAMLERKGANFDVASRGEIELCLDNGVAADRLSFGNTIKKESDIAFAYQAGLRLFAFDSEPELDKLARAAPGRAGILPHPGRVRRRRVAAVAQVRLRAGDGGRAAAPSA